MDRGVWWAIVLRVPKSLTGLGANTFMLEETRDYSLNHILLKVARVISRQIHPFKKKVIQILTASVGRHFFLL